MCGKGLHRLKRRLQITDQRRIQRRIAGIFQPHAANAGSIIRADHRGDAAPQRAIVHPVYRACRLEVGRILHVRIKERRRRQGNQPFSVGDKKEDAAGPAHLASVKAREVAHAAQCAVEAGIRHKRAVAAV